MMNSRSPVGAAAYTSFIPHTAAVAQLSSLCYTTGELLSRLYPPCAWSGAAQLRRGFGTTCGGEA
jgi:hypothetical protein